MLRALRRNRVVSWFTALVLLATMPSSVTWLVHGEGDDPDCGPALVLHNHATHGLQRGPTSPSPEQQHCFVCHSQQLLFTALAIRVGFSAESEGSLPQPAIARASAVVDNGAGARAPPLA